MIALLDTGSTQGAAGASHTLGIALAFGIDALSFPVSLVTLWMMRLPATQNTDEGAGKKEGMFSSIRTGLVHAGNDDAERLLIFFLATIMLLINGPFVVVIPVLACSGNGNGQRLYRDYADHLGAKAHAASDAGTDDEPGDVCDDGSDSSFYPYSPRNAQRDG